MKCLLDAELAPLELSQSRLAWLLAHLWEIDVRLWPDQSIRDIKLTIRPTALSSQPVQQQVVDMIDGLRSNTGFAITSLTAKINT